MAAKKTGRNRSTSSEPSLQQQAEHLQRKLGESAQQIWLAGVGAFGRAQTEGGRLFDTLVREGRHVEQRAGKVRGAVDSQVHEAGERAAETFGRIDQAFRSKVQGALKSLEVPTRRELGALLDKIDALNDRLRSYNGQANTPATKARKSAAKKSAPRTAPSGRPAVKKAATKATGPRSAAKKTPSEASTTEATLKAVD